MRLPFPPGVFHLRKTLYLKFILAYILFGIFGFIAVATFVSSMLTDYCRSDAVDRLYREATQIANTYAADLYKSEVSIDSVYRQLTVLSEYIDSDILILNPSGRIVVRSGEKIDPNSEIYVDGFNPTVFADTLYIEGNFWDTYTEDHLSVLAPITGNYRISGYVIISQAQSVISSAAVNLLNISYIMLLILLLLSMIILIFFTEIVYVPLKKITTATEQYAAGNMHYRFSVDSEDEMGYLAAILQYMASEIARSEDDQKKFIANVSHDFRSPLTSIRGFLEAMLDGTIPPEKHEKYLQTVLNETDRLTKLTNGLLTLNNLNTDGMLLQKSDFDINDTIRSVAASFEDICRRKSVRIELVLSGQQLFVTADRDKIQQVLYNLTDNAIKFSPASSSIRMETTEQRSKVLVSVRDFGIGIPKEDQKYIFDRFYKTDLSRGKDKRGTGLGLSIVREILKAHGENINVISTEGVGSEFLFTLPRSPVNDELDD